MLKETIDCIDAGTEYCPCHLAESGECILCSQLQGSHFCDCLNWKGVCIYQELHDNGGKAKEQRKTYNCKIVERKLFSDEVLLVKFEASHKLVIDLAKPG
ncbi:MAG: sulfide/dihydroorotate dehydrogenase-like FAD/NAD-binding protein, partial [Clostridium celatum]|nr:sulfide/dihydroorotate dehydrogenase-like FAD/NAD-binding protein [Clostridium celatum]